MTHRNLLGSSFQLRGLSAKNRIVISPMCQYSASDGLANDWHFAHLARFALGGAGIIFIEATAVIPEGRITDGDLGLWNDRQVAPLRRIVDFLKSQDVITGIQLSHAGQKASSRRPWEGGDRLLEIDGGWTPVTINSGDNGLADADLDSLIIAWEQAAKRALAAGVQVLELHCAHGYLLHQFLSPLTNRRRDAFGGNRTNRMRFPLRVAGALRRIWPSDRPFIVRVSAVDGMVGGLTLDDTIAFCKALKDLGVDVIDCSSGGIAGSATAGCATPPKPLYQVPYAEAIRAHTGLPVIAVGLITNGFEAESILRSGKADLIAVAREALKNPNWALQAIDELDDSVDFSGWPTQAGWWLERRDRRVSPSDAQPPRIYADELRPGMRFMLKPELVSKADIIRFARRFDPQPQHLSEHSAQCTIFGELVAPGWYTLSRLTGMAVRARVLRPPDDYQLGLSINDIRFLKPIRPGETLHLEIEIIAIRPSKSRPHWSIVDQHWKGINGAGDVAVELRPTVMMHNRPRA